MKSLSHIVTHFPWKAYALLVCVLYLGHWLGATVVHWSEEATHGFTHHHPWITAIVSGLLLTVLVVALHHLHHHYRRPKRIPLRLLLWSLSTAVVVVAYGAATFGEHAVHTVSLLKNPIVFVILCLLGMGVISHVLRDILRSIEGPEDITVTSYPKDAAKTLILHVSLIAKDAVSFGESQLAAVTIKARPGTNDPDRICILKGEGLDEDIAALSNTNWPWQQLLRAIKPHRTLRKVVLIGSKPVGKKPGSFELLDTCAKLLEAHVSGSCEIVPHPEPVPFEDFNSVKRTLREIVLREARSFGEGSVVIDVTGGQATTSIAAAAATIGTEAIFQYVQTNEPNEVVFYDIHNANVPNPHGH